MTEKLKKRFLSVFVVLVLCAGIIAGAAFKDFSSLSAYAAASADYVYLSDLEYEPESMAGWVSSDYPHGHLTKDKTFNNTQLSVYVGNGWRAFDKGLMTHAEANVYYNVKNYNYKYLTAYVGMDQICGKNTNGAKFFVYTSNDDTLDENTSWTLKTAAEPTLMTRGHAAEFLSAEIGGAKYIRLYVDPNGNAAGDYATWADLKLTNSATGNELLDSYDERIRAKGSASVEDDEELELLVLQREFVRRVGQYTLEKFESESEANKEVFDWLFNDLDVLREFVFGGAAGYGNYYKSLKVLSDLYRNYKTDLDNDALLNNKYKPDRTYGEMYRTMMFAIALTHDITVGSWMQSGRVENQSDPLRRYAIYRYMYDTGRFIATVEDKEKKIPAYETQSLFGSLTVEEMRWIMFDIIDDESIIWLNDYVQTKINEMPQSVGGLHTPHGYIAYTTPNYGNPVYYAEENRDYFNELFAVDDRENPGERIGMWDTSYTIPGGVDSPTYTLEITPSTEEDKIQKVWMNFRNKFGTGSVCGGISKSGTNIRGARGIPCTVIGQPGHAAMLYYSKNTEGKGLWRIDNDVSDWNLSTKNERHLLGWGNESWQRNTHPTVVYFNVAQDALNDYDSYVTAEEKVMQARSYTGDAAKQERLGEEAVKVQPINIDAWYSLIQSFIARDAEQDEYVDLIKRISDKMVGYPLAMYDLLNVIKPQFTTTEYIYQYTLLENKALVASSVLPNTATDKTLQPGVARGYALYLLGDVDTTVATFSFDGENAGCIVLSERFDNTGIRWKYSLDGKNTWKEKSFTGEEEHIYKLTDEELASINEENDIYILIVGLTESEENYFKIDISSKPVIPDTVYANDNENKIFGVDNRYEWRYSGDESADWTPFTDETLPDCTGLKSVDVRIRATGGSLSSDIKTFDFTYDTDSDVRKYVSVSHMAVESYSSQSLDRKRPYYATCAIDGNVNTFWHTNYGENIQTSGNMPYLVIKLDEPRYISGFEFAQTEYTTKYSVLAKSAKVLVSEDGENWTEAGKLENIDAVEGLNTVTFDGSIYGQYVRLELETDNAFSTVSLVNIYEDLTKLEDYGENTGDNSGDNNGGNTGNNSGNNVGGNTGDGGKDGINPAAIIVPVVIVVVAGAGVAAFIYIKRHKTFADKIIDRKKAERKKSK